MSNQQISIVGDSFGCGELQYGVTPNSLEVTHSGVTHFLSKLGHTVTNYSVIGASSDDILDQIKFNELKHQNIIVFATDSLRDLESKEQEITQLFVRKNYSIKKIHKMFYLEWYDKLVSITEKNNCNVVLIGGHANLYETDNQHNHIKICETSWLSNIFKTEIGDLSGISHESLEFLMAKKPIKTDAQKEEMIDIMTQKSKRLNLMANSNYFPDNCHPNRICHEALTQKIINYLT